MVASFAGSTDYAAQNSTPATFSLVWTQLTSVAAFPACAVGQTCLYSAPFTSTGTHAATWDWGDGTKTAGTISEVNGCGAVTASHAYAVSGTYTITLAVTQQPSASVATIIGSVVVLQPGAPVLMPDPIDPTKTALYVACTCGHDQILFGVGLTGGNGVVQVAVNGRILGTYKPTGHLIAYALGGHETIMVGSKITQPAWLFGGGGNNTLVGGGGKNLLIGGPGTNKLTAGPGGSANNMLIPGTSPLETNFQALCTAMAQWGSGSSSAQNAAALLAPATSSAGQSACSLAYPRPACPPPARQPLTYRPTSAPSPQAASPAAPLRQASRRPPVMPRIPTLRRPARARWPLNLRSVSCPSYADPCPLCAKRPLGRRAAKGHPEGTRHFFRPDQPSVAARAEKRASPRPVDPGVMLASKVFPAYPVSHIGRAVRVIAGDLGGGKSHKPPQIRDFVESSDNGESINCKESSDCRGARDFSAAQNVQRGGQSDEIGNHDPARRGSPGPDMCRSGFGRRPKCLSVRLPVRLFG